jgi:predicted HTH transcriptional regulator
MKYVLDASVALCWVIPRSHRQPELISWFATMSDLKTLSLDSLPASESDRLEYKSSRIDDERLKGKLQNAASAFWNSGGGVFFAGVDDHGVVDGGIAVTVGRQNRADWLAQIISVVQPQGHYSSRLFEHPSHQGITQGHCVLGVDFAPSTAIPHQSGDHRYYIRAGAHTVPAPHFIVEALLASRHFHKPRLAHLGRAYAH